MKTAARALVIAFSALALAVPIDSAQAQGRHGGHFHRHGHGHWGPGLFWGGVVGIGLGIGLANSYYYGPPWYPGYVVAEPPPYAYPPYAYYYPPPPPIREPVAKGPPDPIIYPRNGQSAAQTEADRQACNRWATTQANAMAEASVFHRATLACMEGRGYTVR